MTREECRQSDPFAAIAPYYDSLMSNVPYDFWVQYVIQLASRAGRPFSRDSRVLDLATGTGSVALEFVALGCRAAGMDRSLPMLAEARRKAMQSGRALPLLCCDLTNFHLPAVFDHAVCLYDSLNYLLDSTDLKRAFANIAKALKPTGLLIFDVNTVAALEAELFTQDSQPDSPVEYHWRSEYQPKTRMSRIDMHFAVPATGASISAVHYQRAYTDRQLRSILGAAGLTHVATYDAYRFCRPTRKSDRVFYVAAPRE